MRIVMNKEFGIESSYTLEASLSGCRGYHFSISDLLRIGKDFCYALYDLQLLMMQRNEQTDAQMIKLSADCMQFHNADLDVAPRRYLRKHSNSSSDDSGGSDSNPSEDNMSESDALQLLRSNSNFPLKRKKKKKKKSRNTDKTRKKVASTESKTNAGDQQKSAKVLRSCTIIQIGGTSPISGGQKVRHNDPFNAQKKKLNAQRNHKQSLKSVAFSLGHP